MSSQVSSQVELIERRDSDPNSLGTMSYDKERAEIELPELADVVDWDGPEDLRNPMNWSKGKRLSHVALVSIIIFLVLVLEFLLKR